MVHTSKKITDAIKAIKSFLGFAPEPEIEFIESIDQPVGLTVTHPPEAPIAVPDQVDTEAVPEFQVDEEKEEKIDEGSESEEEQSAAPRKLTR